MVTAVNKMQLGNLTAWQLCFCALKHGAFKPYETRKTAHESCSCTEILLSGYPLQSHWLEFFFFLSYFKAKGCAYSLAGPCFFMLWYLERTEINK